MARAALLVALPLLLGGCGPLGPMGIVPGGPFLGSAEEEPVSDWSFTDEHLLVAVETRGEWFRHSVTVLCAAHGGSLWIPSRHAPSKRWVKNLERDPRVRVKVGDRVVAGRATRVTESLPGEPIERAFLRKYYGLDVEQVRFLYGPPVAGDDRAELWIFRVDAEPAS